MIKIDREAVMKIAVNGDLFTLNKGMHELNLTVGGVPFREDGLVNQVFYLYALVYYPGQIPTGEMFLTGVLTAQVNPRLDGCMKEWKWLTGEDTSIQETIRSNDNMQCFNTEKPGTYYPGTGFALFNISYGVRVLCVAWLPCLFPLTATVCLSLKFMLFLLLLQNHRV